MQEKLLNLLHKSMDENARVLLQTPAQRISGPRPSYARTPISLAAPGSP